MLYGTPVFLNYITFAFKNFIDSIEKKVKGLKESQMFAEKASKYCLNLAREIAEDENHPLQSKFTMLPSGRRWKIPF
jgi:hypothetical protein